MPVDAIIAPLAVQVEQVQHAHSYFFDALMNTCRMRSDELPAAHFDPRRLGVQRFASNSPGGPVRSEPSATVDHPQPALDLKPRNRAAADSGSGCRARLSP